MSRAARALLMLTIGLVSAQLIASGNFAIFVQQRMRLPLLVASVVLIALGSAEVFKVIQNWMGSDFTSRKISAGPLVSWLMVAPLTVLFAVQPTSLGTAAASRVDSFKPTETSSGFDTLPTTPGAVSMDVYEFLDRAFWDEEKSLEGKKIQLVGLVFNDPELDNGFKLTKFMVSCCAADGVPLQVNIVGVDQQFKNDTWVKVIVEWEPPEIPYEELDIYQEWVAEAKAIDITEIDESKANLDPYESPY